MDLKAGQRIHVPGMDKAIKVMAVAEGYVMARFMGRAPFCNSEKEFRTRFGLGPAPTDITKEEG